MIDQLDQTLKRIFDDAQAPLDVRNADVSFEMPEENFTPASETVNLYLYDVRENRDLRDPVPIYRRVGPSMVRFRPPLRVDCSYMVTTWSPQSGETGATREHLLLSQAIIWLSQFPTIPATFFPPEWADPANATFQPFPPLMAMAQTDGVKEPGEFWTALGSPPRASFNLLVTIAMDLRRGIDEGPPVATKQISITPNGDSTATETWFQVGGTVTHSVTSAPLADAQAVIVELGKEATSNANGQFSFSTLAAGSYTLRVSARGFATSTKTIVVPGPAPDAYDIQLSP